MPPLRRRWVAGGSAPVRVGDARALWGIWLAAAALIVFRSLVFVFWEQSYFESDQAIVGLMAKHVGQLRAFPLFFYGQQYMLAIELYLAAPFLLIFGVSVAALKLPLLAINLAIAMLLLWMLVRDAGLSPWAALLASLFFVVAPPIAASRLIEAQGGNIEPLLFVLLLWLARERPVAFGLLAGVGIMNREFTVYGLVAIVALQAWYGVLFTRSGLRAAAIVVAEVVGVAVLVRVLIGHADLLGPGTAGTFPPEVLSGQTRLWASKFCINPAALIGNLRWLFGVNLSALFGWTSVPASAYVRSAIAIGHPVAAVASAVVVVAVAGGVVAGRRPAAPRQSTATVPGRAFPAYLLIVGVLTAGVYAAASCVVQDPMLVRYTLLALFIPVGLVTMLLGRAGATPWKMVGSAAVLVWAASAALDDGRLLAEYLHHPPRNEYRELADYLEREGIRYAEGPYWTAYQIDFLTNERVIVGSYEKVRINEYQDSFHAHQAESATLYFDDPCKPSEDGVNFLRWCVLYITRARHPAR